MAGPKYPLYERDHYSRTFHKENGGSTGGTLEMVAEIQALILKGAPFHLHHPQVPKLCTDGGVLLHVAGHCQEASGNLLRPYAFVKVTR